MGSSKGVLVRAIERKEPDLRKLARALIAMAQGQAQDSPQMDSSADAGDTAAPPKEAA